MRVERILFLCLAWLIVVLPNILAKRYTQCDLVKELMTKHKIKDKKEAAALTCLAYELSRYDTTYATANTYDRYFGIFILPEKDTCSFDKPGKCGKTCDKFLDDDITDDLKCLKAKILTDPDSAHNDELKTCKTDEMVNKYLKGCGMNADGDEETDNEVDMNQKVQDTKSSNRRKPTPRAMTTTTSVSQSDESDKENKQKPITKGTRPPRRPVKTTEAPEVDSEENITTKSNNKKTRTTPRRQKQSTTTAAPLEDEESDESKESVPTPKLTTKRHQASRKRPNQTPIVVTSEEDQAEEHVNVPPKSKQRERPTQKTTKPAKSITDNNDDENEPEAPVPVNKGQKRAPQKAINKQSTSDVELDEPEDDSNPRPFRKITKVIKSPMSNRHSASKPKQDEDNDSEET